MFSFYKSTIVFALCAALIIGGASFAKAQTFNDFGGGGTGNTTGPGIPDTSFGNLNNLPSGPSITDPSGNATGNTADVSSASASSPQAGAAAKTPTAKIVPQVTCGVANIREGTNFILGCIGQLVHFVWFSLMAWFMGIMGFILNLTVQEFIVSFGAQTTMIAAVTEGWVVLRDLANMVIIFFLLATGIGTILRLSDWGWKQLLARVIIAALVINFSLFITKIIIDTSNLFTAQIYAGILTKAYDPTSEGIQSCAKSRQERATELAQTDPNAPARGLLQDPCLKSGLSGAFTKVLRMTTLMTVPKDTKGVTTNKTTGDKEFGIDTMHFLIIGVLGGIMFFVLAIVFGGMAVMLLTRWVALIMLMIFSPAWMIGLIFGKGGKKYWDRLIENAIFPPVFFVMLYAAYVIAEGSMATVAVNGAATNEIASYTLLATGGGGWDLLLHFALVIMMIVFAMRWAVETGDETAKWGGGIALGAMAGSGYLMWKGAKAAGGAALAHTGGRWMSNLQKKYDAYTQKQRDAGTAGIFSNSMLSRGISRGLGNAGAGFRGRRDARSKSILEQSQRGKGALLGQKFIDCSFTRRELADISESQITAAIQMVGRDAVMKCLQTGTHTVTTRSGTSRSVRNSEALRTPVMEALQKSDSLTATEKKTLLEGKFGTMHSFFSDMKSAEARKNAAVGTADADRTRMEYEDTRNIFQDAVQKMSETELKMFGEQRYQSLDDEERKEMAQALTASQLKWINKDSDWTFETREQVRNDRFGELLTAFKNFTGADKTIPADYERTRMAFASALKDFSADELAFSGIDDVAVKGDTKENMRRFGEVASPRLFDNITRANSPWGEGFKKALARGKFADITADFDDISTIADTHPDYAGAIAAKAKELQKKMKNFGQREFELMTDSIVSGSKQIKDAFALALRGQQLDDAKKALGPGIATQLTTQRATLQKEMARSSEQTTRDMFAEMFVKGSPANIGKESAEMLKEDETIKNLQLSHMQHLFSAPTDVKKHILDRVEKLTTIERASLTPEQAKNLDNIVNGLKDDPANTYMRSGFL